jgi:hypothetical protein
LPRVSSARKHLLSHTVSQPQPELAEQADCSATTLDEIMIPGRGVALDSDRMWSTDVPLDFDILLSSNLADVQVKQANKLQADLSALRE